MKSSDTTWLMDYFRRLAEESDSRESAAALREVGEHFQAQAVGLTGLEPGDANVEHVDSATSLPPAPWLTDKKLLDRVHSSVVPEMFADKAGAWLVAPLGATAGDGSAVAWIFRSTGKPAWTEQDRWNWLTASQALARWISQHADANAHAIQRKLDLAATVAGRLSHDFGNYLTGILGFTELSLSQAASDVSPQGFLKEVLHSAQQGAAWIHRLQQFCRRHSGPCWPTRLASVLTLEEARLRALDIPGLRCEVNLPADLPLVDADAVSLHTAIQEIVNNAREATKNQCTIAFTARAVDLTADDCRGTLGSLRPGAHVELTITDNGPGMSAEDRAKLFKELFFSTKPRQRGVGFLVVYGILRRLQGGLRVESSDAGRGLAVRLFLPTAPIDTAPLSAGAKPPALLLAHSSPLIFDSLRVMLEARGCRVTSADSPQAALAAFTAPKASFALVIIDANLAQMASFEFARRVLDHDSDARLLFLCTQSTFLAMPEEDLLKEFEMLRWPLLPGVVMQAIQKTLATETSGTESRKSSR